MRNYGLRNTASAGVLAAVMTCQASAAFAQSDGAEVATSGAADGDTIVVTAQRREEKITDVPLSVSAFGQRELDRRSIADISDVARITPNLNFVNDSNIIARVSIRGVDSRAGSGTTGIYINDVPIQVRQIGFNAFDVFPQIFDLERVEVLRGPQGTLFGAGSQGGTLRFITPEPSLSEYSGYARGAVSTTKSGSPSYELGAAVGGPLVQDKLAFRASLWGSRTGGYIDRLTEAGAATGSFEVEEENANKSDSYIARFDLKWAPTDNLVISPSIYFQRQEFNDSNEFWTVDTANPPPFTPSFAGAYVAPLVFSDFDDSEFRNGDPTAQKGEDRFFLPSLKVELDLGFATVTTVGSYFDRKQTLADDFTTFNQTIFTGIVNGIFTGTRAGIARPLLPGQKSNSFDVNEQENYAVEARMQSNPDAFGRLDWVLGVFYSENEQSARQRVDDVYLGQILDTMFTDYIGFPVLGPDPIEGFFGIPLVDGLYIFDNLEVATDKQLAGFAQVDYEILDNVTLTAGLRVSNTKFNIRNEVVGPVLGPFNAGDVSKKETPVTPKFAISWQPLDDQLFYASASKGFRIGGANPAVGLPCGVGGDGMGNPAPGTPLGDQGLVDRPIEFNSDDLWSYEIGAKNSLLGGRLRTEVALYHIDWSDIQQRVELAGCGFNYFNNLGSAKIDGFEVAASFEPTENLFLSTAIGYTDARFTETVYATPAAEAAGALPLAHEGDRLGGAPLTVNVTAEYRFIALGRDAYIRADWDRTGHETRLTPISNPAGGGFDPNFATRPVTNFVNLRLGAELFEGFEGSVFATNVLDSAPLLVQIGQPTSTLLRGQTFRPRTIGVRGVYRF